MVKGRELAVFIDIEAKQKAATTINITMMGRAFFTVG